MGKIFYVMGKSSSGKDTVYKELLKDETLQLEKIVLYTTRPIRIKETDGVEYYFVDEEKRKELERADKVIEMRSYHTIHGIWKYFTVYDEHIDLAHHCYLAIGTLESYNKMKNYFGTENLIPIYIEASDSERLERALKREKKQADPNYEEVCRRFLADAQDFSEENILKAGIKKRFYNNEDRQQCIDAVIAYIAEVQSKE